MKAADVMTRHVITVSPDDLVQDVAKILLQHRISGAPVVDGGGKIVGIVSEGDLMRRAETDTDTRHSWWLRVLSGSETLAKDYVRAHARRVSDIMTTTVLTVEPETPLRDAAALMERNRVKRLPVVENERVVGIISRANLLHAFASLPVAPPAPQADDKKIRDAVMERLSAESWGPVNTVNVIVHKGVAELWGVVDSDAEHKALRIVVESTPGISSVKDNVVVGHYPAAI